MSDQQVRSTIGATYVEPSAETTLPLGTRIADLYRKNMSQPYVLQRLSERAYWVQSFNYGTVFYVGDEGVLLFDTLEGVYDAITAAIASVTDKPITAVVYPHYHADHIGDIGRYVEAANEQGIDLRIIASSKTRQVMDLNNSSFPRPTQEVEWPNGSFQFEDLTVELHGFEFAAHTDDHSAWLLKQDRILHSPDLINPDQPPFWKFAGNERFRFHEDNLKQVRDLEWDYLSGSHGNIGDRRDIDFELTYVAELKAEIGKAIGAMPFSNFVDSSANNHTGFLSNWSTAIATVAADAMRPKYGDLYGYEEAAVQNAEMVVWAVYEYR